LICSSFHHSVAVFISPLSLIFKNPLFVVLA